MKEFFKELEVKVMCMLTALLIIAEFNIFIIYVKINDGLSVLLWSKEHIERIKVIFEISTMLYVVFMCVTIILYYSKRENNK